MTEECFLAQLGEELHVWIAYPERITPSLLSQKHLPVLSVEEQQRYARFHFDQDRHHYLAAHALLRHTLSRYASVAPPNWRFSFGANGKPEIDAALCPLPLRFNLTHTRGLVACVVALGRDCGIDVECMRPMMDLRGLAQTVFSDEELIRFDAEPVDSQLANFFTLWTVKEAYIKATGIGLSAPLRRISLTVTDDDIRVEDATARLPGSTEWFFDRHAATANHPLAIAACPAHGLQRVVYHELDLATGASTVVHRKCTPVGLYQNPPTEPG